MSMSAMKWAIARLLAGFLVAWVAAPAAVQANEAAADAECAQTDSECIARKKGEQEAREKTAPREGAAGLITGGGSVVPCGVIIGASCGSPGQLVRSRGPLTVRRADLSVGVDHALSAQWVASALLGVERGRLRRTEIDTIADTGNLFSQRETTIDARSISLSALLTWFPAQDWSIDGSISLQRARYDFERRDGSAGSGYFGDNAGRGWAAGLAVSRVLRGDGIAWVPQAGLTYLDNRVDALFVSIANPPPNSSQQFTVSQQRTRTLAALLELQAQWPISRSFGVLAPYARTVWRQRLSQRSSPVTTTLAGASASRPVIADLQIGREAGTAAAGLLLILPNRTGFFGELGYTRGSGELREARLSLGVKFER
jgi:hypothetical protein